MKGLLKRIREFFVNTLFNPKWKCIACEKEIFDQGYLCDDCKKSMPYSGGVICDHCGRQLKAPQNYCTTCKNRLVSTEKARSVYVYKKPVDTLIQKLKYGNGRYLVEPLAEELSLLYFKSYFNADYLTFVPMHVKAQAKRGYNQSKLLADALSEKIGVQVVQCLEKTKETKRQATLTREQRRKNLIDSFKIIDRKTLKDKTVVIIDDVSTTGSTAEVVAEKLKKAGAKVVYLLTIASVPPKNGY